MADQTDQVAMTPGMKAKADLEELTKNATPNLAEEVE